MIQNSYRKYKQKKELEIYKILNDIDQTLKLIKD